MYLKITTNKRDFYVDVNVPKLQNRAGVGVSVFSLAGLKQRKDEEIIGCKYCTEKEKNNKLIDEGFCEL